MTHMQDELLDKVLSNNDLYVSSQRVLDLTMGKGEEIPKEDVEAFSKNKKKRKTYRIACGGLFHNGIYQLSTEIYNNMCDHKEIFPRVEKRQKTDAIHPIGIFIMSNRKLYLYTRGDIHTIPDSSFVDLINRDENKEKR